MNRVRSSRLMCLAVILLVSLAFTACTTCEECVEACTLICLPTSWHPYLWGGCVVICTDDLCSFCNVFGYEIEGRQDCTEPANKRAATFDQLLIAGIQYCEEYPEECDQLFDHWVESFDMDDEE